MIPRANIVAWRSEAPWKSDAQVEQDLILSRTIVEIFRKPVLREKIAFRGGTAIHKLYLTPAVRYSEDIDLVQIQEGPIGTIIDVIRSVLDPLFGSASWKSKQDSVMLLYRMKSEIPPEISMRLKIEINTREHFHVYGIERRPFSVHSPWFSGDTFIPTYSLEELMGTKLRALYQRRKGRDLFDIWYSLTRGDADPVRILKAFQKYMDKQNLHVTKAQFLQNLELKLTNNDFLHDIDGLLRPEISYNPGEAYNLVCAKILNHI